MIPEHITKDVETLEKEGHSLSVVEADGFVNVVFHDHPIPAGYSKRAADVLVKLPMSYPNGRPDMFWTDTDLTLKGGQVPQAAGTIETVLGKQWRRFSWHPQGWNPAADDLQTYLEFVNTRLAKAK